MTQISHTHLTQGPGKKQSLAKLSPKHKSTIKPNVPLLLESYL